MIGWGSFAPTDKAALALFCVVASFIQKFTKGYIQSINQIHCSARLTSVPQLMLTEHNKNFAKADIIMKQRIYNVEKRSWQIITVERAIHVWGKQAQYLVENSAVNDELIIEGKLSYASDSAKSQFIDAIKLHLFKS